MRINGIKTERVEINFDGPYSELINNIFIDIFKVSLCSNDVEINDEKIIIQYDDSYHGSPNWTPIKIIEKNNDEKMFNLAKTLISTYKELLKF